MSIVVVLVLAAMGLALVEAAGKIPGWPATFVLAVAMLIQFWGR